MPKYSLNVDADTKFSSASRTDAEQNVTVFTSLSDLIQALSDDDDNGIEPTFALVGVSPAEHMEDADQKLNDSLDGGE